MRKTLLVVVASGALIALMPATALAKHHGRRHQAHHVRSHHRRIGRDAATASAPTSPTPAATVTSFDPTTHVLVLTLAGGSTVSGTVTNDTRLVCVPPPSTTQPTGGDEDDQGDQGGDNDGGDQGGTWDQSGGDQGGGSDQGQGDDESNQMCTTADLTTNTPVQFADLSIGQGGANWDTVVLVTTPSSTPPTVPDTDNDGN